MEYRTFVSFDAEYPDEYGPDGTPPGAELAEAIRNGLVARGLDCDPVDPVEEYAFSIEFRRDRGNWHLVVGHVGDPDGRQWLAALYTLKSGLLRKAGLGPENVTPAVHAVLTEDLGVSPQWFTRSEWEDTSFGRGAAEPL